MEAKTSALAVSGSGALVGGGVAVGSSMESEKTRTLEDLKTEEFKSGDKVKDVLKREGLEVVSVEDSGILEEIKEGLVAYIEEFSGYYIMEFFQKENNPITESDLTTENIVSGCQRTLEKNPTVSKNSLWDAKLLCTKDITNLTYYRSPYVKDYAPLSNNVSDWSKEIITHPGRSLDFEGFKKGCREAENVHFRRDKNFKSMKEYGLCFVYEDTTDS